MTHNQYIIYHYYLSKHFKLKYDMQFKIAIIEYPLWTNSKLTKESIMFRALNINTIVGG
ncbi:MAG: hypothetical protein WBL88_17265 [Nitrososphaeraceae archaeon]